MRLRVLFHAVAVAAAATVMLAATPPARAAVVVSGASWLHGRGVDVCYPSDGGCPGNDPVGGVRTAPYQCVELPQRLYNHLGWYSGVFAGVASAYQIYGWAHSHGMAAHRNGGGYVPVPGDMIVSGPSAAVGAGHVAIVDTVDLDRGVVHAVEQNADPSGRSAYRLRGSTLSRAGPYGNVIGVVHSPLDHLRNGDWDGRFHDGWLYRAGGNLYLIAGGARVSIGGRRQRARLGYRRTRALRVPAGPLRRLPRVPRDGTLLHAPHIRGLWLIHHGRRYRIGRAGRRRLFTVPAGFLERIPRGIRW